MTSIKRWLLGIGGVLAVLIILGTMLDQPEGAVEKPAQHRLKRGRPTVPVTIAASDLEDAYDQNEIAASSRYGGVLLSVRGTIDQIAIDRSGIPYVDFKTGGMGVRANFTKGPVGELQRLSKGETLAVTCIAVGKSVLVHLKDCQIE